MVYIELQFEGYDRFQSQIHLLEVYSFKETRDEKVFKLFKIFNQKMILTIKPKFPLITTTSIKIVGGFLG